MYIITRHTIETNEILILGYDLENNESAYMRCFNLIMDDINESELQNTTTVMIEKTYIKVFYRTWSGKYLLYNYEIHLED